MSTTLILQVSLVRGAWGGILQITEQGCATGTPKPSLYTWQWAAWFCNQQNYSPNPPTLHQTCYAMQKRYYYRSPAYASLISYFRDFNFQFWPFFRYITPLTRPILPDFHTLLNPTCHTQSKTAWRAQRVSVKEAIPYPRLDCLKNTMLSHFSAVQPLVCIAHAWSLKFFCHATLSKEDSSSESVVLRDREGMKGN